jgi:predicted methyltransferase
MRFEHIGLLMLAACETAAVPRLPARANAAAPAAPTTAEKLRAAARSQRRRAKDPPRDRYVHPVETLEFFGLRDDMRVVEISPYAGYWTELLAPVVADRGHLRVANGDPISEGVTPRAYLKGRFDQAPDLFGKVEVITTDWTKDGQSLGPDESADLVLTFRNMHDWLGEGAAERVLAAAHRVLRPGGTLALTDHRGKDDGPTDARSFSDEGGAYVPEPFMIALVEKAGFALAGRSEINANPIDTKDYPKGALALPPIFAHGDTDRARYEAIGEGDCMTLKFTRR